MEQPCRPLCRQNSLSTRPIKGMYIIDLPYKSDSSDSYRRKQVMNVQRSQITEQDFYFAQDAIRKLADYFSNRVVGQNALKHSLIASIIADGHILIESVPGLAKTTAAKAISDAVDGKFSRIQCTPDLLPSDIIGTQIYHQQTGKFETIFGPVFANFVLLDEVNRSSAKT